MKSFQARLLELPEPEGLLAGAFRYADHGFGPRDVRLAHELLESLTLIDERQSDDEADRIFVHTYQLIAQIEGTACLPFLLDELELADEAGDDCFPELFPELVLPMGKGAVAPLLAAFRSAERPDDLRDGLAETLARFAAAGIEAEAIVAALADSLEGEPELRDLKGFAVAALCDLKATSALPAIRAAFEANLVNVGIAGDLEEVEMTLGLRERRSFPAPKWGELEDRLARQSRCEILGELPADAPDLVVLDQFLRLYRTRFGIRDVLELDGFLLSVLVAPRTVSPIDYYPFIWDAQNGDVVPEWDSQEEAERFLAALLHRHNALLDALLGQSYQLPAIGGASPGMSPQRQRMAWQRGLALGISRWARVSDDPECPHGRFIGAVLAFGSQAADDPELDKDMDMDMPPLEVPDLLAAALNAYEAREPFDAADFDDGYGPPEPFRREEPKIGRNDPCPCGSGKKFKRCCGN